MSNDWVIRYDTRFLQMARQSGHAPARSTVLVRENAAGALEMLYRGRLMRWSEIPAPPAKPATSQPVQALTSTTPSRGHHPAADHPWQRGGEDYRPRLQLAAAKRAWMAVQP